MRESVFSHARPSRSAVRRRPPQRLAPHSLGGLWHSIGVRNLIYQALVIILVISAAMYLIGNAQQAMSERGIATGFGFLNEEAGFAIGESVIAYSSSDSYLKAYGVAILNTLKVSAFAIVAATLLGTAIGIARLSPNWLLSRLSALYVEVFRNTPQLVQIVFWYTLITRAPHPKQAWDFAQSVFISNRGLILPWPVNHTALTWIVVAFLLALVIAWMLLRFADHYRRSSGKALPIGVVNVAIIVGLPLAMWLAFDSPTALDYPQLKGFNFRGGVTLSPEFLALLLGLSLYIAAFIAEIVRSGIQAVGRGQVEAALSVGLNRHDLYRKVVLPQALRVMIPPAAAQYVSLTKNSSLGVAIGYPELFNVNNTITTLSGNTVECIGLMMAVYLSIAFCIAVVMNLYNKAVEIKER